jgi:hypothetical protein
MVGCIGCNSGCGVRYDVAPGISFVSHRLIVRL